MRVMFTIGTMGRGGAEVQVKDLALRLAARGHHVAIVVLLPFLDFEAQLRAGGVELCCLDMTRGRPSAGAAARFLAFSRRFRPDIVHAHMFAAIMLARTMRPVLVALNSSWRALVCTSHSGREVARGRYEAYRLTSWLSERWTSVSRAGLAVHLEHGATTQQVSRYVPNGIDLRPFERSASSRELARATLNLDESFLWLAVGSFRDDDKDYGTLLRAFAGRSRASRSRLLIAGDGALLSARRALATELGIADHVQFLGLRSDVDVLMQAADAYVLSSRAEAMPMVLLEAAASSLPIVTTDVGDCSEVVARNIGGLVVPSTDAGALAAAIDDLEARSPAERERMGRAERALVASRFAIDDLVALWEATYRELIDAR